jgi:DNA mismatch endonuclease (patch repair protein)
MPKSNENYWGPKLERNVRRDKAKNKRLEMNGWRVLRFWEHELKETDAVLKKVQVALKKGADRTAR